MQIAIQVVGQVISAMPTRSARELSVQLPPIVVHQTTSVMQPPADAQGSNVMQQMRPQFATLQQNSAILLQVYAFASNALQTPIAEVTRFAALSSKNAYVLHVQLTPIAVGT